MSKKSYFKDQVVVVTGASSGIGSSTATAFAQQGAQVVLVARNREKLSEVSRSIESMGGRALSIPTDVTSDEQLRRLAGRIQREFGRIDILFNNAGTSTVGAIEQDSFVTDTKHMMDTDVFGTINSTRALLPLLRNSKRAQIINMSSVVGRKTFPRFVGYSICMHAVAAFSDGLRQELRSSNIHVATMHPALTQTPLLARIKSKDMPPPFHHMTPIPTESVARAVIKAAKSKRVRVVVPWQPRFLILLEALFPSASDIMVNLLAKPWFTFVLGMNNGKRYQHGKSNESKVVSNSI